MASREFFIELPSSVTCFLPGQIITGRVVASFNETKEFLSISILFEGKAKVSWQEWDTKSNAGEISAGSKHVRITDEESYFCSRIMLLQNEGGSATLPAGTTCYPFTFTLPKNIPSSFISKHGAVHYFMEAVMKRSWFKSDLKDVVPFTLNGVVDLNTEYGAHLPVDLYREKFPGSLCCVSGPIALKVTLARQGFVPGDVIPLHIDLVNGSKKEGKSRQVVKVISEESGPKVEIGETESWVGDLLQVPNVPPSRLGGCRIIDVAYELQISMDISNARSLQGQIPIKIGTIPFKFITGHSGSSNELPVQAFAGNLFGNSPTLLLPDPNILREYSPVPGFVECFTE